MRANFTALRLAVLPVASILALVPASRALAQSPTLAPPGNSAVSQYLEMVPTASGAKPTRNLHPRSGSSQAGRSPVSSSTASPVSSSTARRLDAHGALGRLTASIALATAPRSAPRHSRTDHTASAGGSAGAVASVPSPPASVLSAVTGSSSGGGLGVLLPILLGVILIGGGGLAFLRRRAKADPPST